MPHVETGKDSSNQVFQTIFHPVQKPTPRFGSGRIKEMSVKVRGLMYYQNYLNIMVWIWGLIGRSLGQVLKSDALMFGMCCAFRRTVTRRFTQSSGSDVMNTVTKTSFGAVYIRRRTRMLIYSFETIEWRTFVFHSVTRNVCLNCLCLHFTAIHAIPWYSENSGIITHEQSRPSAMPSASIAYALLTSASFLESPVRADQTFFILGNKLRTPRFSIGNSCC